MQVKGVNLGNWLVLEKWMSPALWDGADADDEYYLPRTISRESYEARIKIHRSEYITERDFARIASMGLNTIRIPVPYFIYGDRAPFIGCIDELDHAFSWAEKYGLKILIDLHTVPMSQNGFDNGGICGVCKWAQMPEEVEFVLNLLEKLSKRYGHREGLFGIEPVNEPVSEEMWTSMDVQGRYPARDPEMGAGSAPISLEWLQGFYDRAYEKILPNLAEDKFVVFHDGFRLNAWKDYLTQEKFRGRVILDTHQYLMVSEMQGCEETPEGYLKFIHECWEKWITEVESYVPAVVGEWCIFNSYCVGKDTRGGQTVLNGQDNTGGRRLTDEEKRSAYMAISKASLEAFSKGSGYFYWTYKMLLDTANDPNWQGWDCWDLAKSVDQGWFPEHV